MIDLRPLLRPDFWLDSSPPPLESISQRIIFGIFAVLLIMGAIIRMVASRRQEDRHVTATFTRLGRLSVTMGLIGLVIYFFSFEEVPFLGARFWFLFWTLGLVIWLSTIIRYVWKTVPQERREERERKEKEKYLPKPKP